MNPSAASDPSTINSQPSTADELVEFKAAWPSFRAMPDTLHRLEDQVTNLETHISTLRRSALAVPRSARLPGDVSDDAAREIASTVILQCAQSGRLEALSSTPSVRDALLSEARSVFRLTTRAALTSTDIPLPNQYGGEIRELISEFGVARRRMTHYPIGLGCARPARMGTRPAFGSIAMSGNFAELSPTIALASLESHKAGGIVRLPREIDEQGVIPMGRYLARYGAVEFARLEDKWAFLADGTTNYEATKGIVQIASDSGHTVTLATTKTKPSDATLDDFRAVRRSVNKAALSGRLSAYYLDTTWETRLSAFKTQAEPNVYQRLPDGTAVLDGYPIVWTDVIEPYSTNAAPGKAIAIFGALGFWWLGEHGSPRLDTSDHIYFANDQIAVRFIEEIDFDYCAIDATSALITAAS